ncbi:hypothetical protein [Pinibacter soli]|uniref:Uncharacterized protein n=1 Tax=Pinibacter soli TaxID=3044211 RepID=A0ABT6RBA3_9BACT|nr:hypothetical protein [Pinibacter soli]MDI3319810.1 hypothetical protein [Pinibacter soli]
MAEQKEANHEMVDLAKMVGSLNDLNNRLANNFENFQTDLAPANLRSTEALIDRHAEEIKRLIAEQPKEIKQEKRYLFFPEHNVKDYYNVCLKWFLYLMIATYVFLLLRYFIERLVAH